MQTMRQTRHRSLFWPIVLIGVGLIWFLGNLGIYSLSLANLAVLLRLWPILLIVVGVDILLGRRYPALGALLGFAAATGVLLLVLLGPSFGWVRGSQLAATTEHFAEPMDQATSARVELDIPAGSLEVDALSDSNQLIQADMTHIGQVDFDVAGNEQKMIRLQGTMNQLKIADIFDWGDNIKDLHSEIGLNPTVPLDLQVNLDVGDAKIDLSELQLTNLDVHGNVGQVRLALPALDHRYPAKVAGDVGSFQIDIAEAADLDLDIEGDVGSFMIDVPEDVGVRLEADVNLGNVNLPTDFRQIKNGDHDFVSQSGIWESANFGRADHQVHIRFNGDIGDLTIR